MVLPVIVKPIPAQIINEQASYGPFDLKPYIQSQDENDALSFSAGLADGSSLPKGLICTEDGLLTGIPAKGTQGHYDMVVTVVNYTGATEAPLSFTIKPSVVDASNVDAHLDKLKEKIWQAVEQKLPIPDFGNLYEQPITVFDVYYLLERWATLTIWDAMNLEPSGEKVLLNLEGTSVHYNIYDRGSCLVASPKDLYSHERTIEDSLQTARVMTREVYKRGWTIEFAGFEKMERALWVEAQHLEDRFGRKLEIVHYSPTLKELQIYTEQAKEMVLNKRDEP
jgi:hypothetical protein